MNNISYFHNNCRSEPFVKIREGYKSFNKSENPILNDFSMTVEKGSVYALLGSSGCGKTTAITTLVGLQKLDKGQVFVNMENKDNLKSVIGYMPQEISLYREFSILETLVYFGKLYQVDSSDIYGRIQFLIQLLCLPHKTNLVGKLSGGEQRRVSFAVALIHEPELVILDEPTSGLDPLIRIKIWNHMKTLTKDNGATIILTTHYTDEARHADVIGVMQNGRLMIEENPQTLLNRYDTTSSLDDVILQLLKEKLGLVNGSAVKQFTNVFGTKCNNNENLRVTCCINTSIHSSVKRIHVLVWKNWLAMLRNLALLCFVMVMPAVTTLITCTAFRHEPQNLPLGIVNFEALENCGPINRNDGCLMETLSCKFLEELQSSKNVHGISFRTLDSAKRSVLNGDSWGVLVFQKNFSMSFVERMLLGGTASLEIWNMSTITVYLDQTNSLTSATIITTLYSTLETFSKRILEECGHDPRQGEFPLQYQDPPLVGGRNLEILDYVVPGFSFGWLFFFPLISTSIRLIGEKRQGIFSRTLTCGGDIGLWEILVAYIITEAFVIFVQATLTFCIMTSVFHVGSHGDSSDGMTFYTSTLTLAMLNFGGFSGLCCGFLLGLLCSQEIQAALLSIAIFFPNSFISGLVWPLEGMPLILQYISPFLPFTLPSEALRSLMSRGWELGHPSVWPGFLVVTGYTTLYVMILIIFLLFFRQRVSK